MMVAQITQRVWLLFLKRVCNRVIRCPYLKKRLEFDNSGSDLVIARRGQDDIGGKGGPTVSSNSTPITVTSADAACLVFKLLSIAVSIFTAMTHPLRPLQSQQTVLAFPIVVILLAEAAMEAQMLDQVRLVALPLKYQAVLLV